jgi:hypothetical protein
MNGLRQPRHPSLDNLRRPQSQHNSRSYPNLQAGSNGGERTVIIDEEESPLQKLVGITCAAAALGCFTGMVLLLLILYLTIRPFSQSMYRRLAATLGCASFLDAMTLLLPNMRLYLTGDSDVPSSVGTSLLVCNHVMDGDWWTILMLGRCVGLRGSIKVFLRNECLQLQPQKRPKGNSNGSSAALVNNCNGSSNQLTNNKTVTFTPPGSNAGKNCNGNGNGRGASLALCATAQMLHTLLDFPVLSNENNYIEDREDLFSLLKSFAETNGTPVHLLLFPEAWSLHETNDRKAVLAKSNEFAKREGRPQLKHLLLPRTTGFNASLESLRESSPVVYDVTMAYRGYDGSTRSAEVSVSTLWSILRKPREFHIRIKRYSMEEVLQDASWLDKQWVEKDRLLGHFSRHQQFPIDSRGFCRHRVFDTREFQVENSVLSLMRLLIIPLFVPILLLLAIPIFWIVLWLWIFYKCYQILIPDPDSQRAGNVGEEAARAVQTPGSEGVNSAAGTPFFPATPFGSPTMSNWRDMLAGQH